MGISEISIMAMRSIVVAIAICFAVAEQQVLELGEEPTVAAVNVDAGLCGIKDDGCTDGFFVSDKCICRTCTVCTPKEFLKTECGGKLDTGCVQHATCDGSAKFQKTEGTPKADTICEACKACEKGTTQDGPCSEKVDRTCKTCTTCGGSNVKAPTWTKFVKEACTASADTTCTDCTVCETGREYQATPCGETQNRECKACTTCDGQTNFQSAKCTETKDTQCDACLTCSSAEYVKSSCSAEKNTVCAAYGLTVKGGQAKGKVSKATTKRLKDTEIAFVRCVNDDVGISVCTDATSLQKKGDHTCDLAFVASLKAKLVASKKNGKGAHGACKPKDGNAEKTLADAEKFCKSMNMRIPGNETDLATGLDTGCGQNSEQIWYAGVVV